MRTRFLALAFACVAAAPAAAAAAQVDPVGAGFLAPPAVVWTGPYAGVNLGAVTDSNTRFDRTVGSSPNNNAALAAGVRPSNVSIHDDGGFTGGAQIGYNQQLGAIQGLGRFGSGLVVGVEADAAYTDVGRTRTLSNTTNLGPLVTPSATPYTRVNQYSTSLDYVGTVRGRLGYAFDRFLIYGTGGFAYGQVNRQVTYFGPNAPTTPFFQGSNGGMKTGYAYGGGIEYAVPVASFINRFNFVHASAVTIRGEYLHYDLGSDTLVFPGVNGGATLGSYTSRVRTDGDLARVALNYKF